MNWSEIEGGWSDYQASAKQQWDKLSDRQLGDTHGNRERLSLQVQKSYAVNKDESERQISAWQSRQMPATTDTKEAK
jgi:uncharacterized protein YjbJ (UPF0337 family)